MRRISLDFPKLTLRSWLVGIGMLIAFVLMLQSQITNPKVDNFLNSLSTLANADAARAAFNTAKFSEADRRLLENGFRDPRYAVQVERLVKTIKGPAPTARPAIKEISVLKQDDTRKIVEINQRVTTQTQSLLATSVKVVSKVPMPTSTPPKITLVSPTTITPGQKVLIRGTDLLPRGSITFTFGSSSFEGQVSDLEWTNDLISVLLPDGIRGVKEQDGTVTVKKPGFNLRADAPIHFVPTWEYRVLRSNALTYASQPWDLAAALALFFFTGQTSWCAQFDIYFPGLPSYNLLNTWAIHSLYYDSDHRVDLQGGESTLAYIGSTRLPSRTSGQLCHPINKAAEIYCVVTIKGPLGVPYK
jgi:hypothetical protein